MAARIRQSAANSTALPNAAMRGIGRCLMDALIKLESPGLPYHRAELSCAASIPTSLPKHPATMPPADSTLASAMRLYPSRAPVPNGMRRRMLDDREERYRVESGAKLLRFRKSRQ